MNRSQQLFRGVIAGAAAFAMAACATEGPTEAEFQPAFDTQTTRQVQLCKIGLNPLAVGQVITFHYSVDGGIERTTQRTAEGDIGACTGGPLMDNDGDFEIPIGATISVREELPAGGTLVLATATTGFVPGTEDLCPISVDYETASGEFDVCSAAFPVIFFKNTLEEEETGSEGCTPGYWKVEVHHDSWIPTGYATGDLVQNVFTGVNAAQQGTLLNALNFGGGPGVDGAEKILLRAAVASLLNASHPGVDFPRTEADVIADVSAALGSNDRDAILALAAELDEDNNLGCTLN